MAQSYQKNINTGAETNHPAQKPNVTADQGITEQANKRPDVASNKDTSSRTDTGGDPNVPPNPNEIKEETASDQKQEKKAGGDDEDEGDAPKPPPGMEYPEQKHAGKVGYGPAYAETHGVVGMGERFEGLKQEIKGKILRKPELVQQGRDKMSGEAKRKQQEEESKPIAGPAPAADPTAGDAPSDSESKDDDSTDDKAKVSKGSQGDKPVAQAAKEGAEKDNKEDEPAAREAEDKSKEANKKSASSSASPTKEGQPSDISEKEGTTQAEKADQGRQRSQSKNESKSKSDSDSEPNPPAPHKDDQLHEAAFKQKSSGSSYSPDEKLEPNPPAPFKDNGTGEDAAYNGVKTTPPKGHEGAAE